MPTNSNLWYVGDKPVIAAYNRGEQVYPVGGIDFPLEAQTHITYKADQVGKSQLIPVFAPNNIPADGEWTWIDEGDGVWKEYDFPITSNTFIPKGQNIRIYHPDNGAGYVNAFQAKYFSWVPEPSTGSAIEDVTQIGNNTIYSLNNLGNGFEGSGYTALNQRIEVISPTAGFMLFMSFAWTQDLSTAFGHIDTLDSPAFAFHNAQSYNASLGWIKAITGDAQFMFQSGPNVDVSHFDVCGMSGADNMFEWSQNSSDLSGWKVPLISSEPPAFATAAPLTGWPLWGTPC